MESKSAKSDSPPLDLSALAREMGECPDGRHCLCALQYAAEVARLRGERDELRHAILREEVSKTWDHESLVSLAKAHAQDSEDMDDFEAARDESGLTISLCDFPAEVVRLRGELEQAQQSLIAAEASEQSTREASMRWQMHAEQAERDLAQAQQVMVKLKAKLEGVIRGEYGGSIREFLADVDAALRRLREGAGEGKP